MIIKQIHSKRNGMWMMWWDDMRGYQSMPFLQNGLLTPHQHHIYTLCPVPSSAQRRHATSASVCDVPFHHLHAMLQRKSRKYLKVFSVYFQVPTYWPETLYSLNAFTCHNYLDSSLRHWLLQFLFLGEKKAVFESCTSLITLQALLAVLD